MAWHNFATSRRSGAFKAEQEVHERITHEHFIWGKTMRVAIEHTQKTTGLFSKTTHYIVSVTVHFSEEEKHALKNAGDAVVVEREPGSQTKPFANAEEAAILGRHLHLKVSDLLRGKTDSYSLASPAEAKTYDANLRASLQNLKDYILANTEALSGKDTFEL